MDGYIQRGMHGCLSPCLALVTNQMLTTDGVIGQKLLYVSDWIYYCLLPKTFIQLKHLPSTISYLSLSARIKQHSRLSGIIISISGGSE